MFDNAAGKLYEMYKAHVDASTFRGGCLAVWETAKPYGETLRPVHSLPSEGARVVAPPPTDRKGWYAECVRR